MQLQPLLTCTDTRCPCCSSHTLVRCVMPLNADDTRRTRKAGLMFSGANTGAGWYLLLLLSDSKAVLPASLLRLMAAGVVLELWGPDEDWTVAPLIAEGLLPEHSISEHSSRC